MPRGRSFRGGGPRKSSVPRNRKITSLRLTPDTNDVAITLCNTIHRSLYLLFVLRPSHCVRSVPPCTYTMR